MKDLGIFCDRSCADNIRYIKNLFRLKAVSSIKRLLGPKTNCQHHEGRTASNTCFTGLLPNAYLVTSSLSNTLGFQVGHFSSLQKRISIDGFQVIVRIIIAH